MTEKDFQENRHMKYADKKIKKIVYIDNDKRSRKKIDGVLVGNGYRCFFCDNGKEGFEKILKENPDLVIINYALPDFTAEEFYTQFLTDYKYQPFKHIPFILLTNNGKLNRSRYYGLGFSACLGKPYSVKELIEFVEDVFASHQIKMEETQFWTTIHEAKDFLERVVESSIDSIITTDRKGIITYCNHASEEMLGYSFEEMVGKRVSKFLADGPSELMNLSALLRRRKKLPNYKTMVLDKRGRKIPINLSISTMQDGNGKVIGVIGISKETEGKNFSEYDSYASDRLAAVVETAVAVNHEVNNPLVPILGNAQFLLHEGKIGDEDSRKRLRIIIKNALRIRDITQKLANITHPVTKEYLKGTRMLDIDGST